MSKTDLKHIVNNHTKVGEVAKQRKIGLKSSIFRDNVNIIDLILNALEHGKEIKDGARVYECGKIIGDTDKFGPSSTIIVCLNEAKDAIKTAFPK